MRAFTGITAAAVLAAGLTVAGTGAALAATADEDDSRPGGVLGFLLDGVFGEDTDPPVVNEDPQAPAEEAPAAPAEQSPDAGGAAGGM